MKNKKIFIILAFAIILAVCSAFAVNKIVSLKKETSVFNENADDISLVVIGDFSISDNTKNAIEDNIIYLSAIGDYIFMEDDIVFLNESTIANESDIIKDLIDKKIRIIFTVGSADADQYLSDIFSDYPDELTQTSDDLQFFTVDYYNGMQISEYSFSNKFFISEKELFVINNLILNN